MSDTPLQDALDKLNTEEGFDLTATKPQDGEVTIVAEGAVKIGAEWSLAAAAAWVKDSGYAVYGKLRWRPKA